MRSRSNKQPVSNTAFAVALVGLVVVGVFLIALIGFQNMGIGKLTMHAALADLNVVFILVLCVCLVDIMIIFLLVLML